MRINGLCTALSFLIALFLCSSIAEAESMKTNPHSDDAECAICHVASKSTLRGWFVPGSTKRDMKLDLNQLCLQCHKVEPDHSGDSLGVGKGHATGKKPILNREELPLNSDGTITCATTCHNIHTTSKDPKYLRLPLNTLCVSCHNV